MKYNDNTYFMISLRLYKWHAYFNSNQQLSNWTYGPLTVREIMLGTEDLAGYLGLVKPFILEENLQLSVY